LAAQYRNCESLYPYPRGDVLTRPFSAWSQLKIDPLRVHHLHAVIPIAAGFHPHTLPTACKHCMRPVQGTDRSALKSANTTCSSVTWPTLGKLNLEPQFSRTLVDMYLNRIAFRPAIMARHYTLFAIGRLHISHARNIARALVMSHITYREYHRNGRARIKVKLICISHPVLDDRSSRWCCSYAIDT
jgi:hypothetical protein